MPSPPAAHAPVEADDPTVAQLGPAAVAAYARLEACLADNDRAWAKCKQGEREEEKNTRPPAFCCCCNLPFSHARPSDLIPPEVAALRACTAGTHATRKEAPTPPASKQ